MRLFLLALLATCGLCTSADVFASPGGVLGGADGTPPSAVGSVHVNYILPGTEIINIPTGAACPRCDREVMYDITCISPGGLVGVVLQPPSITLGDKQPGTTKTNGGWVGVIINPVKAVR